MERRQVTLVTLDPKLTLSVVKKKSRKASTLRDFLAEREGFEPPVPLSTTVFKTAAIDHSAISPKLLCRSTSFQKRCKITTFILNTQAFLLEFFILINYFCKSKKAKS